MGERARNFIDRIFVVLMKAKLLIAFCIILITGCEKTVNFQLNESSPKLVVEATIENGTAPVVVLSNSLNYFSKINLNVLQSSFVHNADVYVSNGILTHKLKEYGIPLGNGYTAYYYSNDPSDPATAFIGDFNKQYSLRIVTEGKEYTATTKIPFANRRIDSLFWKPAPINNPATKVEVMVKAYDPPGFGDYVRYFTKRNTEPFYPGLNSVYDDQVIDGSEYEVQVERGINRNIDLPEDYSFFDKGDTVTLKVSNIDKATFDFWRTMEYSYLSVGNPFSSPTKVISNISGGALGYFGGYASQYRTIIIPH
jgi:hypothetical protein